MYVSLRHCPSLPSCLSSQEMAAYKSGAMPPQAPEFDDDDDEEEEEDE